MGKSHRYDNEENKKAAHEFDSRKGHQSGSGSISSMEHVGGKTGVRFKLPEDVVDHSKVRGPGGA